MTITAQVIPTARLDLLPLRADHAPEMAVVLADPALHTFIGGTPETLDGLRRRYRRLVAGSPDPGVVWLNWVISARQEARLAGTLQATVDLTGELPVAEVAWVVGTRWQGRGIATEAARGLLDWLAQRSVTTVAAHIHPDHHASAAVATAAGLAETGDRNDGEVRWVRTIPR